jgi:nucleoid-associated protein YgaU
MAQRYRDIQKVKNSRGVVYQTTTLYPDIPATEDDTYVITTYGDRYDTLALSYYGDINLWWIIACANNSTRDNLIITPGQQIRIPAEKDKVISLFKTLNS